MSKVKNLTTRLLLNPHFQLLAFHLSSWTISPSYPTPRRSLPSSPSPFPTSHVALMMRPSFALNAPLPHAQARLNGLSFRRQSERIPKASRRQSECRASGAIVFSRQKMAACHNQQPEAAIKKELKHKRQKELKHKQQKIKRFYWSNEAKCVTLQPTTSTPHLWKDFTLQFS